MLFNQLNQNETITIEVSNGLNKLEVKTTIAKIGIMTLLNGIVYERKVLNFDFNNLKINLLYSNNEKQPIIWENCILRNVKIKDKMYYEPIIANTEGKNINRRGAFRLPLTLSGTVQMEIHEKATDILVKNISQTGYAFVSKEKLEGGENVSLHFVDKDFGKIFKLSGKVVRTKECRKGVYEYGCELFNKNNKDLATYINIKQRYMLAKAQNDKKAQMKYKNQFYEQQRKSN